jgi:OmpA-OmpF porin, OOP family
MKKVLFILPLVCGLVATAQEGENLVENGSFEQVDKGVKKLGSIQNAIGWTHPTGAKSDLFVGGSKVPEVGTETNVYGMEQAHDGSNFAGIVVYSHQNKVPRTYLTTKLSSPMKKGMKYCVKFYVSLGEYSKYASNNIGVNFNKKEFGTTEKNSIIDETHVMDFNNKIFNATYSWDRVCGTYTAQGGEKFLTIGNFSTDEKTKTERVKKNPDLKGTQTITAYYFIDNISVQLLGPEEKCDCGVDEGIDFGSTVVYSKSDFFKDNMTPEEKASASTIYFGYGKDGVTSPMERDLNRLVELMKANPIAKLKIVGHSDKVETEMANDKPEVFANISQRRINQIIQYLVEQGIPESRLVGQDSGDRKPADSSDTSDEELKQAKNRRIEFVFIK